MQTCRSESKMYIKIQHIDQTLCCVWKYTNLPHDGVLVKARLEETMAGAGTGAELKGDELRVITQLLDSVAALTGVMLLRLRLLTLLLQIHNTYKRPTQEMNILCTR